MQIKLGLVENLPEQLKPLARRNGLEIRHSHFNSNVDQLIQGIDVIFKERAAKEVELATVDRLIGEQTGAEDIELIETYE